MEISKDTTGRFYKSESPRSFENDFPSKDKESQSNIFMQGLSLKKLCLARFKMPDSSKGDFVVSVYRKADSTDFTEEDSLRLEKIAEFLPKLYQRLVASQLQLAIVKVNEILRPRCSDLKKAELPLESLCRELASFFRFQEISVFMREGSPDAETYCLIASTFPRLEIPKLTYRADINDGLTGYVLATKDYIWFHDLHNFEYPERRVQIEKRFKGIQWTDGAAFGRLAKRMLGLSDHDLNPPLPFVAVPVLSEDGNVLGVIRASLGTNPFHFLKEQVEAFRLIAQEIGRWWDSILYRVEQQRRGQVWVALNNTISKQHDTFKSTENLNELIATTVHSIVEQPGFGLASFRRGETESSLRVVAFSISPLERARTTDRITPHINSLLPLVAPRYDRPTMLQGFSVGKIDRNSSDMILAGSEIEAKVFKGMSLVLSRPVYIKSKLYGVLDVGFANELDYVTGQERVEQFVGLVSRQLALFLRIAESVTEVESTIARELETNNVVTHQLRTPIVTAYKRLRKLALLTPAQWNEAACKKLEEVAGMVSKARSVTNTMDAIGKIVSGETVRVHCKVVTASDARKSAIEAALNARSLAEDDMRLDFEIKPQDWGETRLTWEDEFAQQCLDAVISNAFKYSGKGERVAISGESIGHYFVIRVVNLGRHLIRPEDVDNCKKKDWRGPLAQEQEGRGLGLWIADHWMRAQGGELKVYASSKSGETMIELWFARKMN